MRFEQTNCPIDTQDPLGGYAPSWFKDATEYTQTDEQREAATVAVATATRRAKVARLTAGEPS